MIMFESDHNSVVIGNTASFLTEQGKKRRKEENELVDEMTKIGELLKTTDNLTVRRQYVTTLQGLVKSLNNSVNRV